MGERHRRRHGRSCRAPAWAVSGYSVRLSLALPEVVLVHGVRLSLAPLWVVSGHGVRLLPLAPLWVASVPSVGLFLYT